MVEKINSFTCNLREFIIDEIALEGLEGIAIETLWRRLEVRTSSPFSDKMQEKWWNFIINSKCVAVYKLPQTVKRVEMVDRFSLIDQDSGFLLEPEFYLDGDFEYTPAEDIYGSCKHYNTRKLITERIKNLPYKTVVAEYGDYLVLVASEEERWKALAPQLPLSYITQIPPVSYCLLELIGKARDNGQMTTGKTNLVKIVKDSKIMYYYRKCLQDMGLIRVSYVSQVSEGRGVKSLLLRLKRFHKSIVQTMPKTGKIRKIVDYLKEKPNYREATETVIKQGLMTSAESKRYQKKANFFHYEDKVATPAQTPNAQVMLKLNKRRYICLMGSSDESSDSEDEVAPLKCQYKVGIDPMRQAYERFLDAGKTGLTQHELAQLIGVEFYVSRTICRVFKKRNLVREFHEFKGKQRLGRFIAIAATSKMDNTLAEEEKKYRKYLKEGKCTSLKRNSSSDSEPLSDKKKRKMDNVDVESTDGFLENITEMDRIVGYKNKRTNLTVSLRHLKFASGIVKILNEKTFVSGYQTLSSLVAKEIDEHPMDTKAMKYFLQNMINEGHLKVFKVKIPILQSNYSMLICAPHVQKTHPLIVAKYHEMESRARINKQIAQRKMMQDRPMSQYAFPRFVKVQKLHESLMNIIYFNDDKIELKNERHPMPRGFFTMHKLILDLPIGVALGHISSEGVIDIEKFTIENSMHDVKIKDGPQDLQRALLNSVNLNKALRTSLRILATFGLVQFVVEVSTLEATRISDNNLVINLFYLNKIAKIIDTTGIWPRTTKPAENEEKTFHFDCFQDVQVFWSTVYNVSINTTIHLDNRKKAVYIKAPSCSKEQVTQFDTGNRYGDGLGPCGYDSSYYMDIQRLWRAYIVRSTTKMVKDAKKVLIPKLERPKKSKILKKKTKKKVQLKTPKPIADNIKLFGRLKKKKKCYISDWTIKEDRLLMLCKAALTIISPISQPGCLQVRNLVAKDILTIINPKRTLKGCHRRASVIESNSTLTHEKNWIMNEARRHNDLILRYEGVLKKLRTMYPANMTKCINEARVPMMELVWIMYHLLQNMSQKQEIPTINYEEFNKNFTIVPDSANGRSNSYRTPHNEIVVSTLKEAIILTVMLSYNNKMSKSSGEIVYAYFKQFPEVVLRSAVEPLRKCGAIAAKEKILNSQMHIVDLDDITQCAYRISANYQRRWARKLSNEFSISLVSLLNERESEDPIKAGGDTNCFCFELHSLGALELVPVTVPVITGPSGSIMQEEQLNVIDIETNYKLKSGKLIWKNKSNNATLGQIYENSPVEIALEQLSRRSIIHDTKPSETSQNEDIVSYLIKKGENGATFEELLESLKYTREALVKTLTELEAKNYVSRVGFYENIVVFIEFANNWTMKVKNGLIIPLPWLTLEPKIRSDIFFQWAGVVVNKVFEYPGCSVAYLSEHCEFLTARGVQDICEVLQRCECVTLHSLTLKEASLFSDEYDVVTEMSEYNQYESPKNIIVLPVTDCLSKFSYIRKQY